MSSIVLETDRVIVRKLLAKDAQSLAKLMQCTIKEANNYIHEWAAHEEKHGFTIYGVILKKTNALYGYCGCREMMWHDRPEVEMLWCIQTELPNDPNDDLDIETAFYIRNYLFKQFNIKSMFSFIREKDPRGMNLAEEIDMVSDDSFVKEGIKWLIYSLSRDSPKFLRSSGDEDVEPMRTSSLNRREYYLNPGAKFRKPRLKPY